MSHRSINRDIYFARLKYTEMEPEKYITGLSKSPFRTHRRTAEGLKEQLKVLKELGA
jgi:hypothetical protein